MTSDDGVGAAESGDGTPVPPTPEKLRNLPSRLLAINALYADRLVTDGMAEAGARKWHYAVLVSLDELGPASQSALSTRTGVYRSDMVALLNELADQGFVERAPDPDDRRRNVVTITASGRTRLRKLDRLVADIQDEVLAPLNEPERERLVSLLSRVLRYHEKHSPRGHENHR
ncbi:MAG: MarR family winged helix-turn-helix transcriptional regulator [Actinocrinis sp.]